MPGAGTFLHLVLRATPWVEVLALLGGWLSEFRTEETRETLVNKQRASTDNLRDEIYQALG